MIEAKSDKNNYKTIFSNSEFSFSADTNKSKGGNNSGFRPHELLEASLACCMNMWLRMYASNHGIMLDDLLVRVSVNRECSEEAVFEYDIVYGNNLSDKIKRKLDLIAESCPVRKTLSRKLSFKNINDNHEVLEKNPD